MYRNRNSVIIINRTLGSKFIVKVGVHHGSVLSPLLFIIFYEALSRECRSSLPWKMYADSSVSNYCRAFERIGGQVCCMAKIVWKAKGLGRT